MVRMMLKQPARSRAPAWERLVGRSSVQCPSIRGTTGRWSIQFNVPTLERGNEMCRVIRGQYSFKL